MLPLMSWYYQRPGSQMFDSVALRDIMGTMCSDLVEGEVECLFLLEIP